MSYDAYQSYQAVDLGAQTAKASPLELVLILMNGLLDELARARAHIEHARFEAKANSLNRCVAMLNGLSSALDTDAGGEVVGQLAELYDYCARRVNEAGIRMDVALIDETARLLGTVREGWEGVRDARG
ncbi:MAG: flagellar export chaperone FliS [Comamonadaceae bacterium]|uniref:Flagellar secretion chaperone FliS n=1 Tax=Hydrogenophaga borbori TaxID=2294117 RepID=A0A372EHS8_9BURK|nr:MULTISPECIES: flagellar export chaperone FliS [Hydrogenophaga]NCT97788.1 flagellar export chaperone FliS [Comamonadaceae bacterium]RFP78008.1 flagellar export chaperone FliS [Hydrogenophaga borbori]WQB83006.1 flagellar export chaperone FliS [Hydrogenophaga sp. SNF1]